MTLDNTFSGTIENKEMKNRILLNLTSAQKRGLKNGGVGLAGMLVGASFIKMFGNNTPGGNSAATITEDDDNETIAVPTEIAISNNVSNDMEFSEAFAVARQELGAGGFFEWQGSTYNTYYGEEWNEMSTDEQEAFLTSVDRQTDYDSLASYKSEEEYIDIDEDGDYEITMEDIDNDGKMDITEVDLNNDGNIDVIYDNTSPMDNAAGRTIATPVELEPVYGVKGERGGNMYDALSSDTNNDGFADVVILDRDSDGAYDALSIDTDLDGDLDILILDDNEDGFDKDDYIEDPEAIVSMDEFIIMDADTPISHSTPGHEELFNETVDNSDLDDMDDHELLEL